MTQKELNALPDFPQKQNSPETDELISIVLKMASDSAALKAVKDKPSGKDTGEKKYLKFTKQEIETMPEYLKQILLIYNGNAVITTVLLKHATAGTVIVWKSMPPI